MKPNGLTLVETLIALAVMGIAFGALLMSQVSNLRASAQSRYATDAKAAAVRVLEAKSAEVVRSSGSSFAFTTYYTTCTSRTTTHALCKGQEQSGPIAVDWLIYKEEGLLGEGVVNVVVTAEHARGPRVTMGRRITCYDVFPSPTHDRPEPCPTPAAPAAGGS